MVRSMMISSATASDWYWLASDGRLFSSQRVAVVTVSDPDYQAWLKARYLVGNPLRADGTPQTEASLQASPDFQAWMRSGGYTSQWPRDEVGAQTVEALQQVLDAYSLFATLQAYAAAKRYAVETGGILVNGAPIATDRVSQAMIGNAYAYIQASGAASVSYKTSAGFATLTADQIKAVALAVGAHVQACFKAEDDADAAISASPATITTAAEVDALFAALTTTVVSGGASPAPAASDEPASPSPDASDGGTTGSEAGGSTPVSGGAEPGPEDASPASTAA